MLYVDAYISVISPDIPLLMVWLFDFLFHVSSAWAIYLFIDCVGRSTMASTYMLTNQITLLILDWENKPSINMSRCKLIIYAMNWSANCIVLIYKFNCVTIKRHDG